MTETNAQALTVATYNIHAGIGRDGRFDPGRTVRVLRDLSADVIALQEVEHRRVDNLDLLEYLAAALGMEAIPGPTLLRHEREYGNALLTRLPIRRTERVDLTVPGREPRGALDVLLDHRGRSLRVLATHLGLRRAERAAQMRRLLARYDPRAGETTVLLGDLNEWFPWTRPMRLLRRRFSAVPYRATFPARWPVLALDYLCVNRPYRLGNVRVHRGPPARAASDHLPIVGAIEL